MTILARARAMRVPASHQRKPRSAARDAGEAVGEVSRRPVTRCANRGADVGSRSVTCKGHAESGTTCRGKAPRIAKASSASRRTEWKRSGGPHGFSPPLTTRKHGARPSRGRRQGCQRLVAFSGFVIGTNTPARTRAIRQSDSGVVKRSIPRSDGRDARGRRCTQDARETECFDDEPGEQASTGARWLSVGWQKSVGRILRS